MAVRVTDDEIMADAVRQSQAGAAISDLQARVIASQWHGGQISALYSLASCGAIRDDLADEIQHELAYNRGEAPELYVLLKYVRFNGVRGPVDAWSSLRW